MDESIAYILREPKYYKYIDYFCFLVTGIIIALAVIYWQISKQQSTTINQPSNVRVQVQTPNQIKTPSNATIKEI